MASSSAGAGAGGQAGGALLDWADKTLGQGLSHVTKSIKTLVSGAQVLPTVLSTCFLNRCFLN